MTADTRILYRNDYRCPDCKTEWTDFWDATCDDECPDCGKAIQPYRSEDAGAALSDDVAPPDRPSAFQVVMNILMLRATGDPPDGTMSDLAEALKVNDAVWAEEERLSAIFKARGIDPDYHDLKGPLAAARQRVQDGHGYLMGLDSAWYMALPKPAPSPSLNPQKVTREVLHELALNGYADLATPELERIVFTHCLRQKMTAEKEEARRLKQAIKASKEARKNKRKPKPH